MSKQRVAKSGAKMYRAAIPLEQPDGTTRWLQAGNAFEDDKYIKVQLDGIPIANWDGRIFLFPAEEPK